MAKKKIFQEELTRRENLIRYQRLFKRYKKAFEGLKIGFQMAILLILLYIVLVQLNYICYQSNLFRIKDISVKGNTILNSADIILQSGLYSRQHVSEINLEQVERRVRLLPYVKDCKIHFDSLDFLEIEITERIPVVIAVSNLGFIELDEEYTALNVIQNNGKLKNLPLLTGIQLADLEIGSKIRDRNLWKGMNWIRSLDAKYIDRISEVNVSNPDQIYLYLDSGVKLYCDQPEKFSEKFELTERIIRQLHKNGIYFEYINISHQSGYIVKPL